MSVRRSVSLREPPPKILAALATAGENLGYTVQRVDPKLGVLVMTSPWSRQAASLGFIATAAIEKDPPEVELELDLTPRIGFWSLRSAGHQADEILHEMGSVLQAPRARIRRPDQQGDPNRPFRYRPEIAGALWAAVCLLVYGLLVGGFWWIPAMAGGLGGLLLALPRPSRIWSIAVLLLAIASLPFGFVGLLVRREALAQAYWQAIKGEP